MLAKLREALTSKKLWMTVSAAIPLALAHDWVALSQLVMVYLFAQGGVDIAKVLKPGGAG